MAENLLASKGIQFTFDALMAPKGITAPFMSWSWERDFVGALVYIIDPDFPFLAGYFAASILLSFLVVTRICVGMGLGLGGGALLSGLVILGNFARHYKAWHHFEHTVQHWFLILVFLDAWFWVSLVRDRVWSWTLLAWRTLALLGVFGMTGYYWGPAILLTQLTGVFVLAEIWRSRHRGLLLHGLGEVSWRQVGLPLVLSALLLIALISWFYPLRMAASQFAGQLSQDVGYFVAIWDVFRPLWLDTVLEWLGKSKWLPPIDHTETVVATGWSFWLPAWWAIRSQRRENLTSGGGWRPILPTYLFLCIAIGYMAWGSNVHLVARIVQPLVPFMGYFRTSARFGLMVPMAIGAIMAVGATPALARWGRLSTAHKWGWGGAWFLMFALEARWLVTPPTSMPPMTSSMQRLLEGVRNAPGSTVLDMPFCTIGGTGACQYQCPHYPRSIVGQCLRIWHRKKVYGIYQARMSPAECRIYDELDPVPQWFAAWHENRCFKPEEWKNLCEYLRTPGKGQEIGAILLYPDLWKGASTEACLREWALHFGPPLAEAESYFEVSRGASSQSRMKVVRYGGKCLPDQ